MCLRIGICYCVEVGMGGGGGGGMGMDWFVVRSRVCEAKLTTEAEMECLAYVVRNTFWGSI